MRSYLHYGDSSFLYAKAQICFLIGAEGVGEPVMTAWPEDKEPVY